MDTSILQFIILGLATYRITRLFIRDTILSTPRDWFWSKFPPESSKLGYLLTCEWCLSFWIGSLLVFSAIIIPSVTYVIAAVFAVSAVTGLLTAYEDK